MVPKASIIGQKITENMDNNDDFEETSLSNGSGSDEESSVDFDTGGNDFLKAVENTEGRKRKLKEVENPNLEDSNEDNDGSENETIANDITIPRKKKKKKKKIDLANMKPPTAEEMTRLRETENLFHSNLFRLQIEEMIKEVRPKKIERKQIKPWLEQFKEFLMNVCVPEQTQISNASFPGSVKNPLLRLPKEEIKTHSYFHKPVSVHITGSFNAGCCLGPSLAVDVAIVIPKKCFLKEDYLNARYHRKRAAYLGHIANALMTCELVEHSDPLAPRWSSWEGCLRPILLVNPTGKLSSVRVYVTAIPEPATFKLLRFIPEKNNVRESWSSRGQIEDCRNPTPEYNASVIRDLVMMANETVRVQALENNSNMKDAIALLRVWLRQRHLDEGEGSFSGYLVSMLVVALLLSRRLNNLMSSYQIVRNVWLYLSQSDWTKEGLTMCSTKQEANTPSLQDFHRHFDTVFVDTTGYCNLAANIHRLTYLMAKRESQLAVQCLDNPDMNSFQALFMTPMPFLRQFDHVIWIKKNKKIVEDVLQKESTIEERSQHFAMTDSLFTRKVVGLLSRGLGQRVEAMSWQLPVERQWVVTDKSPRPPQSLVLGLRLNTEAAYSVVERGPPANEPETAEFRALWGTRCELRRFRDGTVCEAVVWEDPSAPLLLRRLVTRQMACSLLCDHLGLPEQAVRYLADQLEPLIIEKAFIPNEDLKYGSGEEAGLAVTQVFDRLAKQLRELPDLPLEVASVGGTSAVLRGAEVFPPLACTGKPHAKAGIQAKSCWILTPTVGKAPEYINPVEGVVQLGLSNKWPEDREAVRRIRAAFNIHIAKSLQEKFDVQTQAFPDYVDIFKEGFVFRIHVVYPREVALLKESTTPDGKLCYRDTPESVELEKKCLHLPKLSAALHGVQQQWPAYGVTSRLAKRWLSAQLLDQFHVPDEATELLVASLFLSPEPFHSLAQPQPMFLRFLHLLAHTNWKIEPIIVNFNGDLKRDVLTEIESYFRTERSSLPPLFIATPYDTQGSMWTRDAPLLPVLVRASTLAAESLQILETNFLSSALLEECKVVFRPPLELYDVLIQLKPLMLPQFVHALDYRTDKPVQLKVPQVRKKIPITGFDPAQCYLQELRESYSDYALFFHDTYGGTTIGVLFKPSAFEEQDFKASHVNCRKPVTKAQKTVLMLNFDAIIEDFYILGTGLVKTIDLSPKFSKKLQD